MNRKEFLQRFHHVRQIDPEPDFPLASAGKPAAVLIALREFNGQLEMLLTERAHHLRHHPGQISFPGGAAELNDNNLFDTALREAQEEIGLPPTHAQIIGTLPAYRTISGFRITPVVSVIDDFVLQPDSNEVASAFWAPLDYLINHTNHLVHHSHRLGSVHPIYFIPWQQRMIWGATAAMIRTLSHHLQN
ncbi:CoA pyrophosphatase [Alteromonas aestuariivivens]|uniref:CoA pyrophosphatase n=1 Tax=Alteromonas aestuariivivens TaxID=1938339 RepID=A0A3D8M835_9ALTE|nr:CoA pyrophosphatase [Alteromonas aestuariivivens]RDV25997.1 CoA pyrophosphatase [Alteromonas aestuariivivens]